MNVSLLIPALNEAGQILRRNNLVLGGRSYVQEAGQPGSVHSHNPTAGERVAPGTRVNVKLKSATVTVPNVVNNDMNSAKRRLEQAGLVAKFSRPRARTSNNRVARQSPTGGASARVGSVVTLTVPVAYQIALPIDRSKLLIESIQRGQVRMIGGSLKSVPREEP